MSKRKRISSESAEEKMLPGTSSESAQDKILPGTSSESLEDEKLSGTSSESVEDEMLPGTSSESVEEKMLPGTSSESVEDKMIPGTSSESVEDKMIPGTSSESVEDEKLPGTSKGPPSWDEIYEDSVMSLVCLPEVPMRQILKYLNINDKRNLRLTSWSLKDIVDNELVKIYTLNTAKNDMNNFDPNMLASDCDINFEYSKAANSELDDDELITKVVSTLDQISDRVVRISGPSKFYMKLDDKMTSFSNVKEISIQRPQLPSMLLFPNLMILKLCGVKIENFEDGKFMLNQLEELHLYSVDCGKGLKALLSVCRNIRYLYIQYSDMSDALKVDLNMPNLKKLKLCRCSPEFMYIVTGSASTLTDISLLYVDPEILITSEIHIPNLSKLSLSFVSNRYAESLRNLIAKFASSVQELDLDVLSFPVLQGLSLDFSKLEIFCPKSMILEEAIKVIKHSPNLKYLECEGDLYPVTQPSDQQGAMYLVACSREVDVEEFLQALNNPSKPSSELIFKDLNFNLPVFESVVLTKLFLVGCYITSGFENLLRKCCSDLEELTLENSTVRIDETIPEMKSMKHVTVKYNHIDTDFEDPRFDITLMILLKSCSGSLEKLTLVFEDDTVSRLFKMFHLELPNLKIFQTNPRPTEEELNLILEQFPDDVILWLFESEKIQMPSYFNEERVELFNMINPNDLYIDVSK